MFNCVFKPRFSKCFKYFLSQTAIHCTRISETFELLIFLWHSKQHTQHLICCKWCNYHFLNVLHFEHNDILFSDFGSWISLVELNLGTNQLSRLPGMSSVWLYHFNIWEKPLNYSFHLSLQKFGIAVGLPHHTLWWALL